MKWKSEVLGFVITVVYLCCVGFVLYIKRDTIPDLQLNAIGDFLAGVFGPIAFLWLVLGYLQQGRELKLSSDALQLQAQELKNSVEQQTVMANAALKQIESAKAAFDLELRKHEQSISPEFEVHTFIRSMAGPDKKVLSCVRLVNNGYQVDSVSFEFDPPIGVTERIEFGRMKGGAVSTDIDFENLVPVSDVEGACYIDYFRSDRKIVREEYVYRISSANGKTSITKSLSLLD